MNSAKVVSVRDVPAPERYDPAYTDPEGRAREQELLRLYPGTTDDETAEIRHFLTKGRILEVGLVSGSDEFRDKVAAFREEHDRHFRLKPRELLGFLLITAVPVGALVWHYVL